MPTGFQCVMACPLAAHLVGQHTGEREHRSGKSAGWRLGQAVLLVPRAQRDEVEFAGSRAARHLQGELARFHLQALGLPRLPEQAQGDGPTPNLEKFHGHPPYVGNRSMVMVIPTTVLSRLISFYHLNRPVAPCLRLISSLYGTTTTVSPGFSTTSASKARRV